MTLGAGMLALVFFLLYYHSHVALVLSRDASGSDQQPPSWDSAHQRLLQLSFYSKLEYVPSVDCQSAPQSSYKFCDPRLSPEVRATDLVSRIAIDDLIKQTSSIAPGISSLGIKDYNWRSNCLHGWSKSGGNWLKGLTWTVFAAPIGLGATFDPALVQRVGEATADEGRALHNVMLVYYNGSSTEAAGLNCFSPNVNLLRDPRWGRGQETFGEDPLLLSLIGTAYTKGLQVGEDPKYLKVAACAKHFAVHSGPEELRMHFSATVTLHDLYDTYLPAFKSQVLAGKVAQIMPAYSGTRCKYQQDGAPDAANPFLLRTVLREQFGTPNISIVSDNLAVAAVYQDHKYTSSLEKAAAVCVNATTDLDLGHDDVYPSELPLALRDKLVSAENIQAAVWRSFYLRFRLGDFDPMSMVPYQAINVSHLNTPENQALNLQAARESIVLIKNLFNTLPLSQDKLTSLAIVGPNANATTTLLSNYMGIPSEIVSILQGIDNAVPKVKVSFAEGCSTVKCPNQDGFDEAVSLAMGVDCVIAVMGLDGSVEGESHDRAQTTCDGVDQDILALPGCQTDLVEALISANPRVILVLVNGGPVSLPTLLNHKGVLAVVEVFYPGALGGTALADVLFGEYNPGGKMPYTVYESIADVRPSVDYTMSTSPGRTYRYFKNDNALIPFGSGLSYTEFQFSDLVVSPSSIKPCDSVKVSVSVQNTGDLLGDEVVQVYLQPPKISGKDFTPNIQLLAFERVSIEPSSTQASSFLLNPYLLSLVDADGGRYIFPGEYEVFVGGSLPGEDSWSSSQALQDKLVIEGTAPVSVAECAGSPQCLAC